MATVWRHPGVSGVDATDLINESVTIPLCTGPPHRAQPARRQGIPHPCRRGKDLPLHGGRTRRRVCRLACRAGGQGTVSNATATTRPSPDSSVPQPPTPRCSSASTIFSIGTARVRRSFWLLVTVALGVEATAAFFAQRVLVQVACHVPGEPERGRHVRLRGTGAACRKATVASGASHRRGRGRVGWPGGYECVRQLFRLHRLQCSLRSLGEPSAGLVDRVAHLGLRAVQVVSTDEVLCFCIGLLRPRIVVSTGLVELLDQAELDAVFAHEASHQRRRDPLRLMVANVAIRGLFFVPVLPDLARAARLTTEVEADAAAVDRYGNSNLIRALKAVLGAVSRTPVGVSSMVASDLMSERVQALGGDTPASSSAGAAWSRVSRHSPFFSLWVRGAQRDAGASAGPVHRIIVPRRLAGTIRPSSRRAVDLPTRHDYSDVVEPQTTEP